MITIYLLAALVSFQHPTHVVSYKLDATQSSITWTGKAAFTSFSLTGQISPSAGEMKWDHGNITSGFLEVDMNTITHDEKDLVKHLMSDDFFDVKNHPTAKFLLTNVRPSGSELNFVDGEMTIRGKTEKETAEAKIAQRGQNIVFVFDLTLDRTKYGVNHNSPNIFKDLKDDAIADEIVLSCELVFSPVR